MMNTRSYFYDEQDDRSRIFCAVLFIKLFICRLTLIGNAMIPVT
jgi:hypothetical protein